MKKLFYGDITKIKKGVILHQVNCQNKMVSGVAKALYTKYPDVKENYHKVFKDFSKKEIFGKCLIGYENDNITILNSYSQFNYGYDGDLYTNYFELIKNIKFGNDFAKLKGVPLYIPYKIGCGLGGGKWEVLEPIILQMDNTILIKYEEK